MGRFSLHHDVFFAEALLQIAHERGVQVAGRTDELASVDQTDADVIALALEHIEDLPENIHLRPVRRRQAQIKRLPRSLPGGLRLRSIPRRKVCVQRAGEVTHELRRLFIAHGERARDVNDLPLLQIASVLLERAREAEHFDGSRAVFERHVSHEGIFLRHLRLARGHNTGE